jgi:microcystin-dependent protein
MATPIQPLRGTLAAFTTTAEIPISGELFLVLDAANSLPLARLGDGVTEGKDRPNLFPQFVWHADGQQGYAPSANPSFTGNVTVAGRIAANGAAMPSDGTPGTGLAVTGRIEASLQVRALAAGPDNVADLTRKDYVDRLVPIGSLQLWAGPTGSPPAGWLVCNGQAVNRTTYADLFAVVGTTYGVGDGVTTFNLPDLRAAVPVGNTGGAAVGGLTLAVGDDGGATTHTLTAAEMPAHTHTVPGGSGAGGGSAQFGYFNTPGTALATSSAGSGDPHNNMPPYVAITYLIRIF